ncbi:hypothetical protein [Naumannella halotolerans]|uniref:Uncharacterized protein n=1 Tax=Naumannella halotolerans TaxID=993414 RepID=A0A4R7JBT7_9ACTN|nr:hypothetical protein [Naumannella halotolerans]TDT34083.1 hypothetical protein CLV29_1734 [Naumannella halotolerans]
MTGLRAGLTTIARGVFWDRIAQGRPRPGQWPVWVRVVAAVAALCAVGVLCLGILATPLRELVPLAVGSGGTSLPVVAIPVLNLAICLSVAMFFTAAIRLPIWFAPVAGYVLIALGVIAMIQPPSLLMLAYPMLIIAIVVLMVLRRRRTARWWEFWVMAGLVGALLLTSQAGLREGHTFGIDFRVQSLSLTFVVLSLLAIPALIVAGFGLAEAVVVTAQWTGTAVKQNGARFAVVVTLVLTAVAVFVPLWKSIRRTDQAFTPLAMASGGIIVLLSALAAVIILALGRRVPGSKVITREDSLVSQLHPLIWPIAIAIPAMQVPTLLATFVGVVLRVLGWGGSADTLEEWVRVFSTDATVRNWYRLLLSLVLAVWAYRRTRAGQPVAALALAGLVGVSLWAVLPNPPGTVLSASWWPQTIAALGGFVAAAVCLVLLIGRRLHGVRLLAVLTVLITCCLYPYRQLVAEPVLVFAGAVGVAAAALGLLWTMLTDAGGINHGSSRFPLSSRVLFFCANLTFASAMLSLASLMRSGTEYYDLEGFTGLGDDLLGTTLLIGVILAGIWVAIRPGRFEREEESARMVADAFPQIPSLPPNPQEPVGESRSVPVLPEPDPSRVGVVGGPDTPVRRSAPADDPG